MRKVILISIWTFAIAGVAAGQGWQRRIGQPSEVEQGKFITRTADGGFLLRASAGDAPAHSALLRLDADGDSVWNYTAGPFPGSGGLNPVAEDRAVFNAAGEVFSVFYDSLIKFDAGGQRLFGVPAHFFHILDANPNGLYLWKGVDTEDTLKLRHYDFDGNLLWEKQHEIPGVLQEVKLAPDGRILALYTTWGIDNKSKLAVYGSDGIQQTTIDFGPAYYYKIAFDLQGNYILYETFISGQQAQNNAVYILKSAPNGQLIWKKTYLIASSDAVERIIPAANGNLILTGSSWFDPVRSPRIYGLDAGGNELWKRIFKMDNSTTIKDGVANPDGSFVLTGFIHEQPGSAGPTDAFVWQFNAQGLLYPNLLRGRIVRDTVQDCAANTGEPGMLGWMVQSGIFLSVSDETGAFEVQADSGTTALQLYPPGSLWQACPGFESITLNGVFLVDTIDIPVFPTISCAQMQVSIGFQRLRRCFENTATVSWCNLGTVSEPQAKILVVLPPELDFVSAGWPVLQMNGDSLWFDIGFVGMNACGSFQLNAMVNCDSTVLGQALCTEAHIFPDTFCLTEPAWSGASVQVTARCVGDTTVEFKIKNNGAFPTTQGLEYIIIEDQVVLMAAPLNLPAHGELLIQQAVGNGSLYRIEVDQEPLHPGFSMPAAWAEGCGQAENKGLSLQYPADDGDLFVDMDCQRIIGSYDPNDKSAQPEGFGPEHYIEPNTELTYRIRFQNTGSDTAFTVIIRDTLSPWLNPATVRPESASHLFTWNFTEENTLKFVFNNIRLPDSTTNNPGSNGFVQFRVSPKKDLPLGTVIHNRAAIYFDFNLPVITNETFHTLGRDFILVDTETPEPGAPALEVFPNPFRESATFRFDRDTRGVLSIYTAQGQLIRQAPVSGTTFHFEAQGLSAGIYLFDIRENGRLLARGKMAAQ